VTWIAIAAYLYLAGLPIAAHVASDASGGVNIRKVSFVVLWPIVIPLLYVSACVSAVLWP
jgi:hypothetical protein